MLSEVVCLHVDMPPTGGDQLVALLQDYGRVISKAPVQITEISERPGALFIRWSEVSFGNVAPTNLRIFLSTIFTDLTQKWLI